MIQLDPRRGRLLTEAARKDLRALLVLALIAALGRGLAHLLTGA